MKKIKAFTLIEMFVSLVLISVVLMVVVPGFNQFLQRTNQTVVTQQLLSAFNFARQEAIMRGESVRVCGSSDAHHCDGRWLEGQLVTSEGIVLRRFGKLKADEVSLSLFPHTNVITYLPTGEVQNNGHINFAIKNKRLNIMISKTGRIRTVA